MMRGAREVDFRDDSMTGGRYQVLESLARSVSAICRADSNVRRFYMGIASGSSAISAMERRYDDFKTDEGINEMIAIYRSSSQRNVREIEKHLEDMFTDRVGNINRAPGGAGRPSAQPWHFVYVAVRRWGQWT